MNSGEEVGSKIYSRKQSLRRGDSSFFCHSLVYPAETYCFRLNATAPGGGSVLVGKSLRHTKKLQMPCSACGSNVNAVLAELNYYAFPQQDSLPKNPLTRAIP